MKKLAIGVLLLVVLIAALVSCNEYLSAKPQTEPVVEENPVSKEPEEPFYECFAEGSRINGVHISGLTVEKAIEAVEHEFEGREISISMGEKKLTFSYKLLKYDFTAFEQYVKTFEPNGSTTIIEYDFLKDVNFSNVDFSSALGDSGDFFESKNADLSVDIEDGKVEIIPAVIGNRPVEGVLESKLTDAVNNSVSAIELTEDDFVKPEILSDNEQLLSKKADMENILNKKITLEVCGHTVSLSAKKIRTMLIYDGELKVDDAVLSAYVDDLKLKYDTCGVERLFTTSTGEQVTITKGTYGWIINKNSTVSRISKAILNSKKKPQISVSYSVKGQRPAGDEFQGTYIEVSIPRQHIWMYVNGVCIADDDCTTGEWNNKSNHTREGMFFLKYKKRDVVLRGADYADFVNYWMPYDKNIGLHDAGWRTDEEFGGTNYIGNGSHGCVNLRHDTAETIYNNWTAEIPIIVW